MASCWPSDCLFSFKMKCLYYKNGQEVNPYVGNDIARAFWFFEYHWMNGWEKFKKVYDGDISPNWYFKDNKNPKEYFESFEEAFDCFMAACGRTYPFRRGCMRWNKYLYEHAMEERFYKKAFYVVPRELIPPYLRWYDGSSFNPFTFHPEDAGKEFWWNFECYWYMDSREFTEEAFLKELHKWFSRYADAPWDSIPKVWQERYMKVYKEGVLKLDC